MRDRVAGALLFLPVPLVLWLFTGQPLGGWRSLGLGVMVMLTHRSYARPFALGRAGRRCLWCGGAAGAGPALAVREPSGGTAWRACSEAHAARALGTLGWAGRHRTALAAGILGSLAVFLALAGAVVGGVLGAASMADAVALFRGGVAVTVLPLGWLGPRSAPEPQRPLPFPVHLQALVGTLWVMWLFRLVGLWWLAAAAVHLRQRLG